MLRTLRESEWLVMTADGLFMNHRGEVSQEYPDAAIFPSEAAAKRAAAQAKNLGPYNVVTVAEYDAGVV